MRWILIEELLALLEKFPKRDWKAHAEQYYETVKKWRKVAIPKLEAFLKDRAVPKDVDKLLRKKAKWFCGTCEIGFIRSYKEAEKHKEKTGHHLIGELSYYDVLAVVEAQRAQLKKLINEMPCYEDMDDVGGMLPMVVQMFGVKLDKWRQKVLERLK